MITDEKLESFKRRCEPRSDDHLFSIPVAEVRELVIEVYRLRRALNEKDEHSTEGGHQSETVDEKPDISNV